MINSKEVIPVSGKEVQATGVCRRCDEEICETTAWRASFADDRRDDESIAAHCRPIERNGVQRGFDFLQSRLPRRSFAWRVRKVWTRGQFSRRNH